MCFHSGLFKLLVITSKTNIPHLRKLRIVFKLCVNIHFHVLHARYSSSFFFLLLASHSCEGKKVLIFVFECVPLKTATKLCGI